MNGWPTERAGSGAIARNGWAALGAATVALTVGCASQPPATPEATPRQSINAPDPGPLALVPTAEARGALSGLVDRAERALLDGRPRDAIDLLVEAQTVQGWAQSPEAPAILFWLAHAFDQLGESTAAASEYRRLVMLYPHSAQANRARERLRDMN